jgi:hypothetical protein
MLQYLHIEDESETTLMYGLVETNEVAHALATFGFPYQVFTSITQYDEEGIPLRCPPYFDIDSESLEEAYGNMLELCDGLRSNFQVEPLVYFSGKKGFHVLLPFLITHKRCIDIARSFAKDYIELLDMCVYKTKQLWRVNKSWHSSGKRYKVLLPERIPPLEMCIKLSAGQISDKRKIVEIESDLFSDMIKDTLDGLAALPLIKPVANNAAVSSLRVNPPCLINLWNLKDGPPKGKRHGFINVFTRHLRLKGYTENQVLDLFNSHPFWSTYPESEYVKVVRTIFNYKEVGFGCKSGIGKDVMRAYCESSCDIFHLVQGY